MSIAIYQGCSQYHYEMLGYLIEYFKYTKIYKYVIYSSLNTISNEWKYIYEQIFNIQFEWINSELYNPDNHIHTIVTTEDDPTFNNEWFQKYPDRIIVISHNTPAFKNHDCIRIHNRFLAIKPNNLWALPCYFGITKEKKNTLLNNLNVINVTCVGVQNNPISIEFLKDLISNFGNTDIPIHVHIISRYISYDYIDIPINVHIYKNAPTIQMIDIISKSHYLLCCERESNPFPIHNSMSGAIALSFSFCCQLIIPNTWQLFYGFSTAIGYNDNYVQKNGNTKLLLSSTINTDDIYNETYELILHRNKILDLALNTNFMSDISKTNPLIQILNKLEFSDYPFIYFNINKQLTDNELSLNRRDFRELHFIAKGNSEDYLFRHNNLKSISNISSAIYFELVNSNIDNFWEIVSNRHYKDIILIYGTNVNEVRNKYKKHCMVYTIDDNSVIVINQR